MNNRKIKIGSIAKLNRSSVSTKDTLNSICYLDTSSIIRNVISETQLLGIQEEFPSRAKRKVSNNTIIYSTVRPNLEHFGILKNPSTNFIVSTGFTTIDIIDEDIDPLFLYYTITRKEITSYLHTIAENSVSAYPSITSDDIARLEFVVPSDKKYQQKTAAVLALLDSKIELNNRINAELEAIAKTIYDYWFVQFDFPDTNGKPYKSNGGAMIWNKELKRDIPEGWDIGTLLDIAEYTNGLACQRFRPTGNEFLRVIKIKEMTDGFSDSTEFVRPNIPSKLIVENGDILFSWSASLEVMIWAGGRGALNQHIFKITSNKFPKSFYFYQLVNYLQHLKMMAENRKTTMGHITQEHLLQSRIVLPPKTMTLKLDGILSPMLNAIVKNKEENLFLLSLRDWLLPMLMNGQVSVG